MILLSIIKVQCAPILAIISSWVRLAIQMDTMAKAFTNIWQHDVRNSCSGDVDVEKFLLGAWGRRLDLRLWVRYRPIHRWSISPSMERVAQKKDDT